ncbi:DUF6044 family protein [Aquimarina sp. D1M17]|uniref:DUF6044 family protein n=1 Tax=Aquimarina acroporae TaxID=2937283 RepID=UPI0020BE3E0F|nr:DUF6044 family protein [Aquimarina acroporae]MCK8523316.1 DUF6044 family protein [Aquimarina acroporae]
MKKKSIKSALDNSKWQIIAALILIFLYITPYIYLGKDSHIRIHDNLDSNLVWAKTVLNSGEFFSAPDREIQQVFNGIPRSSLYGTYDISLFWFKLFGAYYGYVFNKLIMSLVAFFGMFYLLKKLIQPDKKSDSFIITGVSVLFAMLPFWSFTLSVAGLPIVLYAFLNLKNGSRHSTNWLIIGLFPFYSSLVLSGIFFIVLLLLILVYDFYQNKTINIPFVKGILLISILYGISHFPIIYSFAFNPDYVSHRIETKLPELSFKNAYIRAKTLFTAGHYHADSLHKYIFYPILFVFILQFFFKRTYKYKTYNYLLVFVFLVSIMYGILLWGPVLTLHKKFIEIIPLQIDRFYNLHPMFWYVLLGFSLIVISRKWDFGKYIAYMIIVIQFVFILTNHELNTNKNEPSYSNFFAEELFEEIKDYIDKPTDSYRVISLGIHPSIALYNGFYTLDGYFPDYPLVYKHKFRKVIAKELDKAPYLATYYDEWGSRCYAFSKELGRNYLNANPKKIKNLDFNYDELKKLGGKYILSSAEITLKQDDNIKFLEIFEIFHSDWKIYVYEVLD